MTFDEYQELAFRTAGPGDGLLLGALGLCGESGEVADLVKKYYFHNHPLDEDKIVKELGDILWYIARTCVALGVEMSQVAEANISKLRGRYPNGFSSERSLNREEGK